jgi:hypothetical protein
MYLSFFLNLKDELSIYSMPDIKTRTASAFPFSLTIHVLYTFPFCFLMHFQFSIPKKCYEHISFVLS